MNACTSLPVSVRVCRRCCYRVAAGRPRRQGECARHCAQGPFRRPLSGHSRGGVCLCIGALSLVQLPSRLSQIVVGDIAKPLALKPVFKDTSVAFFSTPTTTSSKLWISHFNKARRVCARQTVSSWPAVLLMPASNTVCSMVSSSASSAPVRQSATSVASAVHFAFTCVLTSFDSFICRRSQGHRLPPPVCGD